MQEGLPRIPGYEPGMPAHRMDDVTWMDELELMWGRKWGAQSGIGVLKTIIVHRPGEEGRLKEVESDPNFWEKFGGKVPTSLERAQKEHDELVAAFRSEGVEVIHANFPPTVKGIYASGIASLTAMQAMIIKGGAIIGRMAIASKRGLERLWMEKLLEIGCPILYTVHGNGIHEIHANHAFLDPKHVIQATSVRTNMEGTRQIEPILRQAGVEEIHIARLPGYLYTMERTIAANAYHLCNVLSMVDERLALCSPGSLDYDTIAYLRSKKIQLIEAPDEETLTMACCVVPTRPGVVIMAAGNPVTTARLKAKGVRVVEVDMTQTAHIAGSAGPMCHTGPLIREEGPYLED